jgi:predicted aconitase with swiveling domain
MSGRTIVPGEARGEALVLDEPLSLWGGLDPATGRVTDVHHPQFGAVVTGRILVMPSGRGSSSSSSVLAEAIRLGTAPAAIVLGEPDPIVALGSIAARELYGSVVPIALLEGYLGEVRTGDDLSVEATAAGARIQIRAAGTGSPEPGG